jgi:hypothetical protein
MSAQIFDFEWYRGLKMLRELGVFYRQSQMAEAMRGEL